MKQLQYLSMCLCAVIIRCYQGNVRQIPRKLTYCVDHVSQKCFERNAVDALILNCAKTESRLWRNFRLLCFPPYKNYKDKERSNENDAAFSLILDYKRILFFFSFFLSRVIYIFLFYAL